MTAQPAESSPASIRSPAMLVASRQPASMLRPIAAAIAMVVLIFGAKSVFERQKL